MKVTTYASGSTPECSQLGYSEVPGVSGTGQILFAARLPDGVGLPAQLTSTGPEALVFTQSPSYAAELQRLAPAAPGTRWVGFVSAVTNYSTASGPQSVQLDVRYRTERGPDGSPFPGPVEGEFRVGGRAVSTAAPGLAPVVCGPSLTTLYDEDRPPQSTSTSSAPT